VFPGLVPEQKGQVPEAGKTVAKGPGPFSPPSMQWRHDEKHLSFSQSWLPTLHACGVHQFHQSHEQISTGTTNQLFEIIELMLTNFEDVYRFLLFHGSAFLHAPLRLQHVRRFRWDPPGCNG